LFTGEAEVAPLMNAMDIFVVSSISEGMSNTLLEAMAAGLPAVATRVGGNPELVEEGHSGVLFTPRDVQQLARTLQLLAGNAELRARLATAARKRACEQFSMSGMAERYRALYERLAGTGRRTLTRSTSHVRD
jgi:glycosyltransferase involved in cell wall biosynthesis